VEGATSAAKAYLRLRKTPAGGKLQAIRFHDLRPTAFTTMAEKGLPEQIN